MGLAVMYIVHDSLELSLPIPYGADDVPLIFRDGAFTSTGALFLSAKPPT
jgi:spore coat protein A, manganese oxidase